ncbi:MAG: hypothetical protein R6V58_15455, partial [Planctomycetota bacterium]
MRWEWGLVLCGLAAQGGRAAGTAMGVMLLSVLCVGAAGAAEALDLPANQWVVLHDGQPGIMGAHAKFEWIPSIGRGFIWPCYNYRGRHVSVEDHTKVFLYDPTVRQWAETQSVYPKGALTASGPDPSVGYLWMPALKKILFLHGGRGSGKKPVRGWLLNPATWKWEPLPGELRMTDRSTDFNPSPCSDGRAWPMWGALCYDAHNKEALLAGGCGTWGRVGEKKEPLEAG